MVGYCLQSEAVSNALFSLHAVGEAIQQEEFQQITSVLVSRDGELLGERYWNDATATTLHDTRSATKTLVALGIGAATEQGKIANVDSSAYRFFTAEEPFRFDSSVKQDISIRDLLTMSSALDCDDNIWDTPGNEEHMYPARRWLYFVLDLPTRDDYARNERGFGPFHYCTAGSFLLGQVVQRATDTPFNTFFKTHFQEPLNISEIEWFMSPSGEVQTGGGARMASRDLLKLGELILQRGRFQGRQLVNPAWIDEMTTSHVSANSEQSYGYQIWHREFKCGGKSVAAWYMSGNGGNKVVAIRELGLVAVVTATLYGTKGMHEQSSRIVEEFILPQLSECA